MENPNVCPSQVYEFHIEIGLGRATQTTSKGGPQSDGRSQTYGGGLGRTIQTTSQGAPKSFRRLDVIWGEFGSSDPNHVLVGGFGSFDRNHLQWRIHVEIPVVQTTERSDGWVWVERPKPTHQDVDPNSSGI